MKSALALFFAVLLSTVAHSQSDADCLLKESTIDDKPALVIELNDDGRIAELDSVFRKNGYKYKGFMWDNGLWEVVNQKDFQMLRRIDELDEKEDRLVVTFMDTATRERFFKLICPILDDPAELDSILASRKKY